jgi:hypothetical protein
MGCAARTTQESVDFSTGGSKARALPFWPDASERPVAFDLRAMHQAAALRIEFVAAVHDAAIVPQDEVADPPLLIPSQLRARRMGPERVE